MSSNIRDFGESSNSNYNTNPPTNESSSTNPSASGPTGSTTSSDPVTSSYGNTHSSTNLANPIHPSDPQSTAHPAFGNSSFSSPYETGGGNTGQGDGEGPGVGQNGGVGTTGGLSQDYHKSVDAAYGHATGPTPPEGWSGGNSERQAGPYDTGGGNSTQTGPGEADTRMGASAASYGTPNTTSNTHPSTAATSGTSSEYTPTEDNRSTGSKIKEIAHGIKGAFAAAHGAGETARGTFNSGVDRTFKEVNSSPFPSLRPLEQWAGEEEGEFPASVYEVSPPLDDGGEPDSGAEFRGVNWGAKGRYSRWRVKVFRRLS